jgi:hypothetical protein
VGEVQGRRTDRPQGLGWKVHHDERVQPPKAGDPILFNGSVAAASIENLQKLGTVVLMCNNAFMAWVGYLAGKGLGTAADIEKDIRANLLPGVVTVPAMVIAIEKAQGKGIAYNKQG